MNTVSLWTDNDSNKSLTGVVLTFVKQLSYIYLHNSVKLAIRLISCCIKSHLKMRREIKVKCMGKCV